MHLVIMPKEEAKKRGLKYYLTGKPCKHGHISYRSVSSSKCLECHNKYFLEKRKDLKWSHIYFGGRPCKFGHEEGRHYLNGKCVKCRLDSIKLSNEKREKLKLEKENKKKKRIAKKVKAKKQQDPKVKKLLDPKVKSKIKVKVSEVSKPKIEHRKPITPFKVETINFKGLTLQQRSDKEFESFFNKRFFRVADRARFQHDSDLPSDVFEMVIYELWNCL